MTVNDYLSVPWVDGDYGMNGMHCWALVRHYLAHFKSKNVKAYSDIAADDKSGVTSCYLIEVDNYEEGFQDGAIACVFKKKYLFHVGVVVGQKILHTNKHVGCKLESRGDFERSYNLRGMAVRYYHD